MNFSDLNIENKLKRSIELAEFKTPTPIQSQSIPISLEGKDVLGTAQTGTGKTLAFTIPMLNKLLKNKQAMALIICPTRELATQVMETVLKLNVREIGIGNALLIGGESMQKQLRQLKKGARIIVGTPGRINDHIERKSLNLSRVNYLVLDETDRMLDMGFTPQIEVILKFIPKDHQTLLFSATLPENILKISQKYLNNPERVSVGSLSTPIEKIKQETFQITADKKYHELIVANEFLTSDHPSSRFSCRRCLFGTQGSFWPNAGSQSRLKKLHLVSRNFEFHSLSIQCLW